MPPIVEPDGSGPNGHFKSYSCLKCRQRKVRCDRRAPCSNCIKTEKQCSFVPPVRGKRKRTKPTSEGLHAKIKRYECLLKQHGINFEQSEDFEKSDSERASRLDFDIEKDAELRSKASADRSVLEETQSKLVTKGETSRYFENALWAHLGDEFHPPEIDKSGVPTDDSTVDDSELFFEAVDASRLEGLASIHPSPQILSALKDVYVDRVDPLMKILHLPTFLAALANSLQNPQSVSKSFEALAFAFYLAAISTLKDDECQDLFRLRKQVVFSQYRIAARRALADAEILSASSLMTLQAYIMFMMCVRNTYGCGTLFVLSGIAIRLARKMGLHRDGASLGLTPFETEMRRRLWHHLIHVEFRAADMLGTRPSLDLAYGDVKIPLNVEDEQLSLDMTELPPQHNGITAITFCILRCEIIEALRSFSNAFPQELVWEVLASPSLSLAKRDSIIDQIEDRLESKFLRYSDPSNSLHTLLSIVVRSAICKMRLFAHNPRQFADMEPDMVPQCERDIAFENATKMLEYMTILKEQHTGLDKYMWQLDISHLWNILLYMLIEMRRRRTGPEVDKTWRLIGKLISHYPDVFERSSGAVYMALGRWTLEVWDDYVAGCRADGLPQPLTLEFINKIRRCRSPATEPRPRVNEKANVGGTAALGSSEHEELQSPACEGHLPDHEPLEAYEFPDLFTFEIDPNEWLQWEQLVAEQRPFAPLESLE